MNIPVVIGGASLLATSLAVVAVPRLNMLGRGASAPARRGPIQARFIDDAARVTATVPVAQPAASDDLGTREVAETLPSLNDTQPLQTVDVVEASHETPKKQGWLARLFSRKESAVIHSAADDVADESGFVAGARVVARDDEGICTKSEALPLGAAFDATQIVAAEAPDGGASRDADDARPSSAATAHDVYPDDNPNPNPSVRVDDATGALHAEPPEQTAPNLALFAEIEGDAASRFAEERAAIAMAKETHQREIIGSAPWWMRLDPSMANDDLRSRKRLASSLRRVGEAWSLALVLYGIEDEAVAEVRARLVGALAGHVALLDDAAYVGHMRAAQGRSPIEAAAVSELGFA